MSFLDKIRDTFVEDVPEQKPHESHLPSAKSVMAEVPGAPAPAPTPGSAFDGKPDPQALAKLEATIQQSLPDIYRHFTEQVENLRDVIPDEFTRFKAALKTIHGTTDQIVTSLDQLLQVVAREGDSFEKAFKDNLDKMEEQAKAAITATEGLISSREAQLKAIQEEIVSLRSKRDADVQHLQGEQSRLNTVRLGFEAAHRQVVGQLNSQKDRIAAMPKG